MLLRVRTIFKDCAIFCTLLSIENRITFILSLPAFPELELPALWVKAAD